MIARFRYVIARAALGYGARASGFYRDPTADADAFVEALPRVVSVLLAAAWLGIDVMSPWLTSEMFRVILMLGGGALAAGVVWQAQRGRSGNDPGGGA